MTSRSRLLAAAVAAVALCAPGLKAEQPATSDYSQEIKALRQRLDTLEIQQKEADRKRQEAERKLEEKLTSEKLDAEAARHDQFISAEGFTAGYDDGRFTIGSADKNFTLRPWFHMQVRETEVDRTDFQGSVKRGIDDQWDGGPEIRRMRLGVDGNMFSPDFTYFFNWATQPTSSIATVKTAAGATAGTVSNNAGGTVVLEEAWVKYHIPTTDFYLQLGQLRDPILHDQIIRPEYQQSAERSLTADLFANGDGLTEGIMLLYEPHSSPIRVEGGFNHGLRSANTNFFSYADNGALNQFDWGVAGRVEYKVWGNWKDYGQVGGAGASDQLLVVGLGGDYSERGHAGQLTAAADVMYVDPSGFNAYGALVDRYTNHNFGAFGVSATGATIVTPAAAVANTATNEYSILAQAGYFVTKQLEPFGRYEYMHLAGLPAGSRQYIQALTGGANYYFHGHRVKLTAEIMWLPNGCPIDDTGGDVLIQSNGKSEISFVTQLQLLL